MRVFKNAWFDRFARKHGITDEALLDAIARVKRGLIDADLGAGVLKQRVARPGQGRSSGFRTIIAVPHCRARFLRVWIF
ncbi:type II toxin-antitoxin system RelE/ParE family toxin [Advenella kashmirensis]|uniref:type II toxin-antitoxin system RelE/ParE family toxin n=1 Tax=Advenella kashmirensis TaxID=310575 RepID=UPI0002EAACDB|nr:type II toxin-antitoxin system RelE/ParE family toxin [Advenella kashmirensis]